MYYGWYRLYALIAPSIIDLSSWEHQSERYINSPDKGLTSKNQAAVIDSENQLGAYLNLSAQNRAEDFRACLPGAWSD